MALKIWQKSQLHKESFNHAHLRTSLEEVKVKQTPTKTKIDEEKNITPYRREVKQYSVWRVQRWIAVDVVARRGQSVGSLDLVCLFSMSARVNDDSVKQWVKGTEFIRCAR